MFEKLIGWELRKQLAWLAVFLATVFGLTSLLVSNLLVGWIDLSKDPPVDLLRLPFVAIFMLMLGFGITIAFYRLATSISLTRNWIEALPSELMRQELSDGIISWFYDLFSKRNTSDNRWYLRRWRVYALTIFGDALFVLALLARNSL